MDIEELRIFVEICRQRSMRKAAESLRLSQPSLTKKVQKLEHLFGAQLLMRLPRGVEPTAYGKIVIQHAKFAISEISNAREIIRGIRTGKFGSLRVGTSIAVTQTLAPLVVRRVQTLHPDTEIHVVENTVENLSDDLIAGELDLVMAPIPRGGTDRDLVVRQILKDELIVVGSQSHPLHDEGTVSLRQLLDYGWAFMGTDPYKESHLVPLLLREQLPMPKWVVQTNSVGFLVNLLRNSTCIALMSKRLVKHFDGRGIKDIYVEGFSVPWPIMLARRRKSIVTPLMDAFIEALKNEIESDGLSTENLAALE